MFDIGANLCNEQFDNIIEDVLKNAIQSNISHILLTSTNHESYLKNIKIINQYSDILTMFTTYGLHPHNAKNNKDFFNNIRKHLINKSIKALGEFGLDYFRLLSNRDEQINTMEKFINISDEFNNLPLFLHERNAFDDFYSIIKQSHCKGVVHCFTGNLTNLKRYIDLGLYIGITGWISDKRRNNDLIEAIEYLPLDRLMIETDCPYLAPKNVIKNIRINEPQYLSHIAQSISDIKNIPIKNIIEQSTKNSLDLFLKPL